MGDIRVERRAPLGERVREATQNVREATQNYYLVYLLVLALAGWTLSSYDFNLLVLTFPNIAADLHLSASFVGLLGFLIYRSGDRALAEDLLADTFERVLTARRPFDRRRASEKTWLYTIALNLLRDHARRAAVGDRRVCWLARRWLRDYRRSSAWPGGDKGGGRPSAPRSGSSP